MKKIFKGQQRSTEPFNLPNLLKVLEPVEYPAAHEIEAERNKFISFISQIETKPVSLPLVKRIKRMTRQIFPPMQLVRNDIRKESSIMKTVLVRIFIISCVIFSLTSGALAFSLNSLPDSPLYDAKLALENAGLSLIGDPAKLANKHMELAHNRIKEMVKQANQGETPDGGSLNHLQQHLMYALHYAAQVQAGEMQGVLNQVQTQAQNQIQTLAQVQAQTGGAGEGPIGMANQLMHQFMNQLQIGQENPEAFRHHYQGGTDVASLEFIALEGDCDPVGDENKYGQTSDGGSAGPGEYQFRNDCGDCDPVGDEHKYGQTDRSSEFVNEAGDCEECIPDGDEHHYGPQPDQPGPGQPGGNPDCPDCDPEGDKNQYGEPPSDPPPGHGDGDGDPDCPNCDCPGCPNCDPDCPDCDPAGDENKYGKP